MKLRLKRIFLIILLTIIVLIIVKIAYQQGYRSNLSTIENLEQQEGLFTCPYTIKDEKYAKYTKTLGEVVVRGKPQYIGNSSIIKNIQPFNQMEFEKTLYTPSSLNGLQYRYFDVDGDEKDEKIISANTAMNHTPNIAMIIKDNNIIFEAGGANIWIDDVYGGYGFYLNETVDWNIGEIRTTRYIYEDGGFKAIWHQKGCWVTFTE